METMLCGAPIIATNKYALTETVQHGGILIDKPWGTKEYVQDFVLKTLNLIQDDKYHATLQEEGRDWILGKYQWSMVADQWEKLFLDYFKDRYRRDEYRVVRNLLRSNDYVLASEAVTRSTKAKVQEAYSEKISEVLNEQPANFAKGVSFNQPKEEEERAGISQRFNAVLQHVDRQVKRLRKKKLKVLEWNCGDGELLSAVANTIANMGIEVECHGFEIDQEAIEECEKRKKGTEEHFSGYKKCVFLDAPPEGGKYDLVLSDLVMDYVIDHAEYLRNLLSYAHHGSGVIVNFHQGCWRVRDDAVLKAVNNFTLGDVYDMFVDMDGFVVSYVAVGINYSNELIGYWSVAFVHDTKKPPGKIDSERKLITTRPWQTISATMIVRDCEDDLSKCLKSFYWTVDELVIVDTGSKDRTIEIAKRFTDKIYEIEWPDDFSVARNYGLERCSEDWIFWIDSDEVLVNPSRLHKYADSVLYHGYVIRQNHLMLDFKAEPDVPVRFFRNNKGYKFFGVIHEHCEDGMDNPIGPAMALPDMDIAHYGYLNERKRREKCSGRNLELLAKDRKVNPHRKLGLVLLMRDYINLTNWDLESRRGAITDKAIEYLRTCVDVYVNELKPEDRVYVIATPIYQNALALLGKYGVSINDDVDHPPFESALTLAASMGGLALPQGAQAEPERRWFGTFEEHDKYLKSKREELESSLRDSIQQEW
jgi:glycosyltransferase involved in cell wall biosynthesis